MKKLFSLLLILILVFSVTACGSTGGKNESSAPEGELPQHTIAVLVYDRTDDEVISFHKYLTEYIGEIFNVRFIYSDAISSGEEALEFISSAADYGAEGVMSFNSYDLKAEVELCEQKQMYFMMASGTVSDEAFASVENNKYFLGVVGPGKEIEYNAGKELAGYFIENDPESKEFFIFSGGGCLGNEMHRLRTEAFIDAIEEAYGVKFDMTSEEIALSGEALHLSAGDVKVCVCPGYFTIDEYSKLACDEYRENSYKKVLAVLPVVKISENLKGAKIGVVDCYSENNLQMFTNGTLDYVCGKYSSIIGPSFAAMYNAVSGYAEDMRENGKAFRITQGFWCSSGMEDYSEKYALASSIELNAYNYEDLQSVIKLFNSNASFEDLRTLAEAYTYEDALARRK